MGTRGQLLARRPSSPTSSPEGSDPTVRPRPAPPTGSTKPLPRRAGLPGRCGGVGVEQSWYLRKRPRCQSPGTPAASHCCRQLLHPGPPNCALPVARAALLRCARSAAGRPPLSSAAPPPAPAQSPVHRLRGWLAPPLGGRSSPGARWRVGTQAGRGFLRAPGASALPTQK